MAPALYKFGNKGRSRPRNRWQDDMTEDGRIVGGEGWQEKVHNREEWKKFLRMARNRRILHMPMERMNGSCSGKSPPPFIISENGWQLHVLRSTNVDSPLLTSFDGGLEFLMNLRVPIL